MTREARAQGKLAKASNRVSEQGVELESCQSDLAGARAQLADTQAAREALAEKLAVVEAEYRTYKEVRPKPRHPPAAPRPPPRARRRAHAAAAGR